MKLPARSVAWLLPLMLAACAHKTQQAQVQPLAPPIEDNPPPAPSSAPVNLPPPVVTVPQPTPPVTPEPQPQTPAAKPPVKHKKPAPKPAQPQPAAAPQQAANIPAPSTAATQQASNDSTGVSAIGQLSSGDSSDIRQQTEESIISTERGLNTITRPLSDSEQKTAEHIRDFIKQAKVALGSGDVEGAHTLSEKAKVLLNELRQ